MLIISIPSCSRARYYVDTRDALSCSPTRLLTLRTTPNLISNASLFLLPSSTPMDSDGPPAKRHKQGQSNSDNVASSQLALSVLITQLDRVKSILEDSSPPVLPDLIAALSNTQLHAVQLSDTLDSADNSEEPIDQWKDELNARGTWLWNQSTAFKCSVTELTVDWKRAIARSTQRSPGDRV